MPTHESAIASQPIAAPTLIPGIDAGQLSQLGILAIASLWLLQTFLKQHTDQQNDSWAMLEKLVTSQQETNKTLAETNRELTLRLARVHERLERIERWLQDHEGKP